MDSWYNPKSRYVNMFNKVLTSWNKPTKRLIILLLAWNDSKIKDKNQINGFLQLDSISLENFDKDHEQTSDRKLHEWKYWFICPKKFRRWQ